MKVIFNADDFGYSKGVNIGIIETHRRGPVRSTTVMAGMPGVEHAAALAAENPGLGVGIHLTLSAGKSVGGAYRTLTDGDGCFPNHEEIIRRVDNGELDLAEVEAEFEAQIQKVIAAGITPDHFDSHHHLHNQPGIIDVFLKLAKKYDAGVRVFDRGLLAGQYAGVRAAEVFSESFYGESATLETLRDILATEGVASMEIMCHPAFIDRQLYERSSYGMNRATELDVLTDPALMAFIADKGIELCSFGGL
jgi:predicted glycoside hydrolase/deacetylase ChbG (UPF0249 family)